MGRLPCRIAATCGLFVEVAQRNVLPCSELERYRRRSAIEKALPETPHSGGMSRVICETPTENAMEHVARVAELRQYELAEILTLPVEGGREALLLWVRK